MDFDDERLWEVLETVSMKKFVAKQDGQLDLEVKEKGENLSVGQRQLISIARALLSQTKILIMDEATSSIDQELDSVIQNVIRTKLANVTVLNIAHRLHTIASFDRVIVLNNGLLAEFDTPYELLHNPKYSLFADLVSSSGDMTHKIKTLATQKHQLSIKKFII